MRPIYFVKYFDKGSTVLGAEQMSEALSELGVEGRPIYPDELDGIRDAHLIFIKTSKLPDVLRARRQENITILDVQDTLCFKRRLKNRRLFDGVIFRSQKPLDDYGGGPGHSVNIYLQWNPGYQPNRVSNEEFRLAYFGDPRSLSLWGELPDVPCIGEQRFFEEAPNFNCHISIRSTERDFKYKPTCKISSAAACHANLITTKDEASVEVLGSDYPYYTDLDLESIRRTIGYARETFGGPVWKSGLEQMEQVKDTHRLETIAKQYVDFISELDNQVAAKTA